MMRNPTSKLLTAFLLLTASTTAFAHPGHNVTGLTAGLLHPFSGLDHLLAMVAVGLWASQMGGKKVLLLPATFMTALALGAGLAMQWQGLPMVEAGIATSVLALGLLVAISAQLPASLSIMITTIFGLLHGYAHGLELPESAAPVAYAMGFLFATAILHLGGTAIGIATQRRYAILARMLGIAIAMSGTYLLANT